MLSREGFESIKCLFFWARKCRISSSWKRFFGSWLEWLSGNRITHWCKDSILVFRYTNVRDSILRMAYCRFDTHEGLQLRKERRLMHCVRWEFCSFCLHWDGFCVPIGTKIVNNITFLCTRLLPFLLHNMSNVYHFGAGAHCTVNNVSTLISYIM